MALALYASRNQFWENRTAAATNTSLNYRPIIQSNMYKMGKAFWNWSEHVLSKNRLIDNGSRFHLNLKFENSMLLSIYCILSAALAVRLFDLLQLLTPLFSGVISPSILLFLERINVTIVILNHNINVAIVTNSFFIFTLRWHKNIETSLAKNPEIQYFILSHCCSSNVLKSWR